jgi:hypothetical protein
MIRIELENLSKEDTIKLNEIGDNTKEVFNKIVDDLNHRYNGRLEWMMSSVSSRNKYQSELFRNLVLLSFISELASQNKGKEIEVRTSNYALTKVTNYELDNVSIVYRGSIKDRIGLYIRPIKRYLFSLYILSSRAVARRPRKRFMLPDNAILVDTFVLNNKDGDEGSLNNGVFKDRYYPGMIDYLDDTEKARVVFVPTLIGYNKFRSVFSELRKSDTPFLVLDDYLKLRDYFASAMLPFKINFVRNIDLMFKGYDITRMVNFDIYLGRGDTIGMLGILYSRFVRRLAQNNASIDLYLNWHEHQLIDRAVVKGIRTYFPKVVTHGYQGYVISKSLHLYTQPSITEYAYGYVPDRIFVTGKKLVDSVKSFNSEIIVDVAPGFRFRNIWKSYDLERTQDKFTILLGLPISLKDTQVILKLLEPCFENWSRDEYKILVKPHPTWTPDIIRNYVNRKYHSDLHFVKDDFHEIMAQTDLLITSASSVALEAVVTGKPVIIVSSLSMIIQNPIPPDLCVESWRVVLDVEDMLSAVFYFKNRFNSEGSVVNSCQIMKNEYFEKPSRKGVLKLLNLEN